MLVARERLEVSDEALEHNERGADTTATAADDVFRAHWLTYLLRWILDAATPHVTVCPSRAIPRS